MAPSAHRVEQAVTQVTQVCPQSFPVLCVITRHGVSSLALSKTF